MARKWSVRYIVSLSAPGRNTTTATVWRVTRYGIAEVRKRVACHTWRTNDAEATDVKDAAARWALPMVHDDQRKRGVRLARDTLGKPYQYP